MTARHQGHRDVMGSGFQLPCLCETRCVPENCEPTVRATSQPWILHGHLSMYSLNKPSCKPLSLCGVPKMDTTESEAVVGCRTHIDGIVSPGSHISLAPARGHPGLCVPPQRKSDRRFTFSGFSQKGIHTPLCASPSAEARLPRSKP